MPNRETQKLVIAISACFAMILVAIAFLFSTFLEWRGQNAQYSRDVTVSMSGNRAEAPCATTTQGGPALEEIAPLDSAQEDLTMAEAEPVTRTADRPVVIRWERVEGAKAYHVQAWQLIGSKKTVLFDEKVKATEAHIERKDQGEFYWQVAAVDGAGKSGEVAGPVVWREREPASERR